jgi:TM2 domain-containing membrane protein YozV
MTTGPENQQPEPTPEQQPDPTQPYGAVPPPPPPPPPYQQPPQQQPYQQQPEPGFQGYQPPGVPIGAYGVSSQAPYGLHPVTGIPYSDKNKIVAGLLNIFLPFGIGRFYIGDTKTGVLQLVVTLITCGIGSLWSLIDGIIMLATDSKDANGYMLRS